MIKVKKSKSVLIEDNGILIRSITNQDMDYYADWYTKQFAEGFLESMPKEKVDRMISEKLSIGSTLIFEVNKRPIGEICFHINKDIKFKNEKIENPIFNIYIGEFVEGIEYDRCKLINLFLQKDKNTLLKGIKTIITIIDQKIDIFLDGYRKNEFIVIQKEKIFLKNEKLYARIGIENPYQTNLVLLKRM